MSRRRTSVAVDVAEEMGAYGSDEHYGFVLDQFLTGVRATTHARPG